MLYIALQLIDHFKKLHGRRIIHRDIKPQNFLVGCTEKKRDNIYVIDFGLSRLVVSKDNKHIPFKTDKALAGTAKYVSIATH